MYLKTEPKIREVLDVKDKTAFLKLWGEEKDYKQSLLDAHGHKKMFEFYVNGKGVEQ